MGGQRKDASDRARGVEKTAKMMREKNAIFINCLQGETG